MRLERVIKDECSKINECPAGREVLRVVVEHDLADDTVEEDKYYTACAAPGFHQKSRYCPKKYRKMSMMAIYFKEIMSRIRPKMGAAYRKLIYGILKWD